MLWARVGFSDTTGRMAPPSSLLVEVPETTIEMMRGLSGRPVLPNGYGMLFDMGAEKYQPFHMIGVAFPLDFIFVDAHQRVSSILACQPPGRREVGGVGRWIVEAPCRWAESHDLRPGLRMSLA